MGEVVIHDSVKRKLLLSAADMVAIVDLIEVKCGGDRCTRTTVQLVEDEIPAVAEHLMRECMHTGRLAGPFEMAACRAALGSVLLLRAIRAGEHQLTQDALEGLLKTVVGMRKSGDALVTLRRSIDGAEMKELH